MKEQLCCSVVQFSSAADFWNQGLHGAFAETNWCGHKTGIVHYWNLRYPWLRGGYNRARKRSIAEHMAAFIEWLGIYKRSLLHIGFFENQMQFLNDFWHVSSLRREIHFAVCLLLCMVWLQGFTWPPNLAFILLQCNINIYAVFLLADAQHWFSGVSAWSSTLVLTPRPWLWLRSWISQSCLARCDVFGLVPECLEHKLMFMLFFLQNSLLPPPALFANWLPCTLIFLAFPMRATTCRLVIIKLFQQKLLARANRL